MFGCPDCDVVNDVRFPAQLINNYFFLSANGGYDVYDLATNTQVFSGVSGPIESESGVNNPLQDQQLETTDEAAVSAPTDATTDQADPIDINPLLETADNTEIPAQTDMTNVNLDSVNSSSGGGVISIFMLVLLLANRRARRFRVVKK